MVSVLLVESQTDAPRKEIDVLLAHVAFLNLRIYLRMWWV